MALSDQMAPERLRAGRASSRLARLLISRNRPGRGQSRHPADRRRGTDPEALDRLPRRSRACRIHHAFTRILAVRVCPCPAPNLERHEPARQSYRTQPSDTDQTENALASIRSTDPPAIRTRAAMLSRFEPAMWLYAKPISRILPYSAAVQGVDLGRPDVGREGMKLTNPC